MHTSRSRHQASRIALICGLVVLSALDLRPNWAVGVFAAYMPQSENAQTNNMLLSELRRVTQQVAEDFRRETAVAVGPDSSRSVVLIESGTLATIASSAQTTLMDRLTRPQFAAMKDYVALRFPTQVTPDTVDPVLGHPVVSRVKANAYVSEVKGFINRVSASPLAIDLTIRTNPPGAAINFKTTAVQGPTAYSDTTIMNVYRGLYSYTVTKTSFKPVSGSINLVDDDSSRFECTLVAESETRSESSCRRR